MHNFYKLPGSLFVLVILFAVAVTGCKDKSSGSEGGDSNNEFVYDGETYSLGWGVAFDYGEFFTGFRNYDFVLAEVAEDVNDTTENINSDYYIYLWLESKGADSFSGGTFTYHDFNQNQNLPVTNFIAEASLSFVTGSNEEYYSATSGTVEVSIDGDTYTLEIDVVLDNGETLSGSFSADIEVLDESGSPAKAKSGKHTFVSH